MENRQIPTGSPGYVPIQQKDKQYTLQNLLNKLNRREPMTYGSYFVNFAEMFPKEEDYQE